METAHLIATAMLVIALLGVMLALMPGKRPDASRCGRTLARLRWGKRK